jgi:hypothetical protein
MGKANGRKKEARQRYERDNRRESKGYRMKQFPVEFQWTFPLA